jgi:hypothetical protein
MDVDADASGVNEVVDALSLLVLYIGRMFTVVRQQ